jgi:hypothetical protein
MNRKQKTAIAVVIAALIGGGVVAALWSANGSGSGTSKAVTAASVTVNAATGAADLYPGFTGGDVFFTLTNPNPYPVTFTSMTPGAVTSSNPVGCPAANVTVATASSLSLAVGAGATSGTLSISDVVTMVAGAPDGCQGATFTIPLTLSGSQS